MTYIMSDIHGNYEKYRQALNEIKLKDTDTLYILGDVIDRGNSGIKILQDMMYRENVVPILGNHELIAYSLCKVLSKEITEKNLDEFDQELLEDITIWFENGGEPTLNGFKALSKDDQQEILDYITEFTICIQIVHDNTKYILVHSAPENFDPDKELDGNDLYEIIAARTDYSKVYYKDAILITGHTPVQLIRNDKDNYHIYKNNNHIAIDCGCGFSSGKLGVLCLDTMEEFYF